MKCVKIEPSILSGEINIPPSKSMSHRAIICASLSEGRSVIENIIFSEDIISTCEGMKSLGANIERLKCSLNKNESVCVEGLNKIKKVKSTIQCNESGSTLRFLIPIAMLSEEKVTFEGKGKLIERPLDIFYEIFKEQGISYHNKEGTLPLIVEGNLMPGKFRVKGNVSSQFITGLLFALPLLNVDSTIEVTTELESKGYVDLTLQMLEKFSVHIENKNYKEFYIKGNQKYMKRNYIVEGDFSQGAFWLIAGIIGAKIKCHNLEKNSFQGDKAIIDIITKMDGNIIIEDNYVEVDKSDVNGIVINASQCPDLVPILAVLGSLSGGTTKIIKAGRLRIKESDRLKAITNELKILGAKIEEFEDGLIIEGREMLSGGIVDSWNDHRIAMALAVASIRCKGPVIIKNSEAVKKSYPTFWEDFVMLGGKISEWNLGE